MSHIAVAVAAALVILLVGAGIASMLELRGAAAHVKPGSTAAVILDRFAVWWVAGSAVFTWCCAVLGMLGGWRPVWLLQIALPGALCLLAAISAWRFRAVVQSFSDCRGSLNLTALEWTGVLLAGFVSLLSLSGALTPEVRFDPLAYHLIVPRYWLNECHVGTMVENGHSYFPYGYEMLYAWCLSWNSDTAGKVMHWAAGLAGAGWTARLARTLGVRAALPTSLFLLVPSVIDLGTSCYVDLAVCMYALAAICFVLEQHGSQESRTQLACCGVALGSAMAAKYTAWAIVAIPLGLLLAWRAVSRRRLAVLAVPVVAAVVPVLPWIARNYNDTGNPVMPMMIHTLGPEWAKEGPLAGSFDSFAGVAVRQSSGPGLILGILKTPVTYLLHVTLQLHILYWAGIAACVVVVVSRNRLSKVPAAATALFLLLFLCESALTAGHPDARYGLATQALAAVLFCSLLPALESRASNRRLIGLALGAALLGLAATSIRAHVQRMSDLDESLFPVLGREARLAYLDGRGTDLKLIEQLDEHLLKAKAGRVVGAAYPSRTRFWIPFSPVKNLLVSDAAAPPAEIWRTLHEQEVTHIIAGSNPGYDESAWEKFLETGCQESSVAGTAVYQLLARAPMM